MKPFETSETLEPRKKRPYQKPCMIVRGDVVELTKGGFSAGSDELMTGEAGSGGMS